MRTLLVAAIAAAVLLGIVAPAQADYIYGSNIYYQSNAAGRFDVNFWGTLGSGASTYNPPYATNGGGDAGITLAVYGTDSNNSPTATTYGLYGQQPFTTVDGPALTGDGSPATPFVLQSDYHAGAYDVNGVCAGNPCLKVTELAQYRSDQPNDVYLTYHVVNEGTQPVKFRTTLAADTEEGYDDGGVGFFDSGSPRMVGTDNANQGASSSFQEVGTSSWSRWQESLPSDIWHAVEQPLASNGSPSTGLSDTVGSQYMDKAMAVQWDNYTSTGLAAGAGHDFQIFLHYFDYKALTLSNPGKVLTDTNKAVTVTATETDRNGGPVALQANDVHYLVYSGPDAPADQSYQTQAPGATSNVADITWNWTGDGSKPASFDYYEVWVDLNHDGILESNEPDSYGAVQWFDGFWIQPLYTNRQIGQTNQFSVNSYDTSSGSSTVRPFLWKVTGANPQVNGSDPNGMFTCDATNACDANPITLNNTNAGTDTIEVWQDFDGVAGYNGYGEKRTYKITWTSGITLSPAQKATITQGSTQTIAVYLTDSSGNAVSGKQLYYTVTGTNLQDPTNGCAGSATTSGGSVANTACVLPVTSQYGYTTVTLKTASAGDDTLTVWQDDDGVAGSGPTSGDHVVSVGQYSVTLSPDQRLSSTAGSSDTVNNTVGNPYNLGVTLLKADGSPDTTHTLRYYTSYGSIDHVNDTGLTNSGNGQFTIPLADAGGKAGYDVVEYYADYNNNGVQDSYEPSGYAYVYWYKRADIESYTNATVVQPDALYVYARLQHADGSSYTGDFTWQVDGGSVTHGTASTDIYDNASFLVPSQSAGSHTITVSFTDTDGTFTDTWNVTWEPQDTLVLTPDHTDASTGYRANVAVTMTRNQDGTTGPPPAGTVLHYSICCANEDTGKQSVLTDANGHATISWVGTNAGTDYVTVWPDYNDNGVEDGNEYSVQQSTNITFHNRVDLSPTFYSAAEGNTENVTVAFHDDAYNPLANKPLAWQITGANPASGTGTTDSSGHMTVSWKGDNPGQDTLVVWQDTNADGQPQAGEQQSDPLYIDWSQRLTAIPSCCSPQNVGTPYNVDVYLNDLSGNSQQGAVLHWIATGAAPGSGDTNATDSNGHATFQLNSTAGGTDQVTVFLDSNGNGTRDPGEPQDSFSVDWTSSVNLNASAAGSLPEGNTQTITATLNPSNTPGTLMYQVYGTHPQPATAYNAATGIVLNGTSHGRDDVVVWADDGNGVLDSGEPASWFEQEWTPRVGLTAPEGNRVAGGTVSIAVQMYGLNGQPDTTPGVSLNYTITGANPSSGTVTTNSQGKASVTYTSAIQGTDTVTVTNGTYTNQTYVYWDAPPVSLSITHNTTASAYQTNTHTVTAHILGISIPPAGYPVHFSVSGANTVADTTVQSDSSGNAQFTWTGTNAGTDTVSAYGDVSGGAGLDGYDPTGTTTMAWQPLVQLSSTTTDQAVGESHSETVHFVDNTGAPVANTQIIYQITGANPTAGQVIARAVSTGAGSTLYERTDSSGNATITWTGSNPSGGTDTLNVWADTNNNGTVDSTDPFAQKVVTWRVASAASTLTGGGGNPTGSTSQAVAPGSPSDFDGLPTPPPPVVAKTVNVTPVSGTVLVKLPKKNKFIPLLDAESVPVGSIVDVTHGRISLTSAQNLKGGVATADFYLGEFQIGQKKGAQPITDLTLVGGNFKSCAKILKGASVAQKKQVRQLWGSGKGLFRSKGKYASAAIRGTTWDVADYCDGTLVKVTQGLVTVHDDVKNKNITVKAPKSYFAKK